jgi:hypothetical protein
MGADTSPTLSAKAAFSNSASPLPRTTWMGDSGASL